MAEIFRSNRKNVCLGQRFQAIKACVHALFLSFLSGFNIIYSTYQRQRNEAYIAIMTLTEVYKMLHCICTLDGNASIIHSFSTEVIALHSCIFSHTPFWLCDYSVIPDDRPTGYPYPLHYTGLL